MKIRFPVLLACFMGSASFSSQVTGDIDNDSAASSASTNGQEEVSQFHRSCLYVKNREDNEGFIYAERNLADFYDTNEETLVKLHQKGVISDLENARDKYDEQLLHALFSSQTNIAFDARDRPKDLKRDLRYLTGIVFSEESPYQLRDDVLKSAQDLKRILYLINKLCAFW